MTDGECKDIETLYGTKLIDALDEFRIFEMESEDQTTKYTYIPIVIKFMFRNDLFKIKFNMDIYFRYDLMKRNEKPNIVFTDKMAEGVLEIFLLNSVFSDFSVEEMDEKQKKEVMKRFLKMYTERNVDGQWCFSYENTRITDVCGEIGEEPTYDELKTRLIEYIQRSTRVEIKSIQVVLDREKDEYKKMEEDIKGEVGKIIKTDIGKKFFDVMNKYIFDIPNAKEIVDKFFSTDEGIRYHEMMNAIISQRRCINDLEKEIIRLSTKQERLQQIVGRDSLSKQDVKEMLGKVGGRYIVHKYKKYKTKYMMGW